MTAPLCPFCRAGRLRHMQWAGVLQCDACRVGTVQPEGEPLRVACLVPFCRRTRGDRKGEAPLQPDAEWICGEHWRAVPRRLKAIRARAERRGKSAEARRRLWAACKRAAIEAAGGIA